MRDFFVFWEFLPLVKVPKIYIFNVFTFGQSPQNLYFERFYLWSKSPKSIFLTFLPLVKVLKINIFSIYTLGKSFVF